MPYGQTYKMLSEQLDDVVLIESPFQETTRNGILLRSVLLALTPYKFVVVDRKKIRSKPRLYFNKIESQYPIHDVNLTIFKKTRKQMLKVAFNDKTLKYFEIGVFRKRKIFWEIWCNLIKEINSVSKIWPFTNVLQDNNVSFNSDIEIEPNVLLSTLDTFSKLHCGDMDSSYKNANLKWTEKHLYLGSKRELEDAVRPVPVAGLGRLDDKKLLYLKPQYFGCWDQSEHWVQCGDSVIETTCDSNVYTYTGEPTANVTYTSIMTAWK